MVNNSRKINIWKTEDRFLSGGEGREPRDLGVKIVRGCSPAPIKVDLPRDTFKSVFRGQLVAGIMGCSGEAFGVF